MHLVRLNLEDSAVLKWKGFGSLYDLTEDLKICGGLWRSAAWVNWADPIWKTFSLHGPRRVRWRVNSLRVRWRVRSAEATTFRGTRAKQLPSKDPECRLVLGDFGSACQITEQTTRLAEQATHLG